MAVTNIGIKLPGNMNENIFDSMVSIRNDQTRNNAHLGLGLYIVNLIAKKHGGYAYARNTNNHTGVTVRIKIPQ